MSAVLTLAAQPSGTLRDVHEAVAWVMVVGNGLAGVWALAAHRVQPLRGRALWWFTALVQVVVAVQVTIGVGLVAGQGIDPPQFHLFYGFVALITVGIVYSYRQAQRPHRHLQYGGAGLFLMGLGIRAMLVGASGPVTAGTTHLTSGVVPRVTVAAGDRVRRSRDGA